MPTTLKKFKRHGYGRNKFFKIGDKVKTTEDYAKALSPEKMFKGTVKGVVRRESNLNDIVAVDSDDGARHEIDSSWLELMPNKSESVEVITGQSPDDNAVKTTVEGEKPVESPAENSVKLKCPNSENV